MGRTDATTARGSDDAILMPYAIAALVFCLAGGLLVAASAAPVGWLPGQFPALLALCAVIPLVAVLSRRRLWRLSGLDAQEYRTRERIAVVVVGGLILVGLPLLEWTHLHPGRPWRTGPFLTPVAAGLIIAGLCWQYARTVFEHWASMGIQPWEVTQDAGDTIRAARGDRGDRGPRGDRTRALHLLWRSVIAGGIALSLAFCCVYALAPGRLRPPLPIAVLPVAGYVLIGLLLVSHAARLRVSADWQLDRLSVPAGVRAATWERSAATMVVVLAGAVALLLLGHVLDLAHLAVAWLWLNGLAPLLIGLLSRLSLGGPAATAHLTKAIGRWGKAVQAGTPREMAGRTGESPFLWWLIHGAPWVLGALIAALLLRAYLRAGGLQAARGPWWGVIPRLLAELRAVLSLLLRPARSLAAHTVQRGRQIAARRRAARRAARVRPSGTREAVLYLYGQALDAAARRGYARRPDQTPGEYAADLGPHLDAARTAFDDLTDGFVEARFSRHEVPAQTVSALRACQHAVRARLKHVPRGGRSRIGGS